MWMNQTIVRGPAENVPEAARLLNTPEVFAAFDNAPGFHSLFLINNMEDRGEAISVTVWNSAEEGKAFYASDTYKRIFGGIAHLITAPPEYKSYEVLIDHALGD